MLRPVVAPFVLVAAFSLCLAREAAKPEFEVVSIRPGSDRPVMVNGMAVVGAMQGGPGSSDPERLTGNSVVLRDLVLRAYGVNLHQLSGPGWIETTPLRRWARFGYGCSRSGRRLV
jgi:uncharacterized protein (TIGR03435 family)